MIPWHRLLGMVLTEYLADSAWAVDIERDMSFKQQRLDLIIVHRGSGTKEVVWPDGMEQKADYNLITFKSLREPLSALTIRELIGHCVNCRKQCSPSLDRLLPEDHFQMFALTMRFPRDLHNQVPLTPVSEGVYNLRWGTDTIRVIVLNEVPDAERNALWNLFSGEAERVQHALAHMWPWLQHVSSVLQGLLDHLRLEGFSMTWDAKAYILELEKKRLREMPLEERLEGLTVEQLLSRLTPEQIEDYLRKQRAGSNQQKPQQEQSDPESDGND